MTAPTRATPSIDSVRGCDRHESDRVAIEPGKHASGEGRGVGGHAILRARAMSSTAKYRRRRRSPRAGRVRMSHPTRTLRRPRPERCSRLRARARPGARVRRTDPRSRQRGSGGMPRSCGRGAGGPRGRSPWPSPGRRARAGPRARRPRRRRPPECCRDRHRSSGATALPTAPRPVPLRRGRVRSSADACGSSAPACWRTSRASRSSRTAAGSTVTDSHPAGRRTPRRRESSERVRYVRPRARNAAAPSPSGRVGCRPERGRRTAMTPRGGRADQRDTSADCPRWTTLRSPWVTTASATAASTHTFRGIVVRDDAVILGIVGTPTRSRVSPHRTANSPLGLSESTRRPSGCRDGS